MQKFSVSLLLVALCVLHSVNAKVHPFSQERVDQINSVQSSWKAEQQFKEEDFANIKSRLGALVSKHRLPEKNFSDYSSLEVPESFDARQQWPACANIINDIRDQANCGSCWAFGAVGCMSDRICIVSNGQKQIPVSADDLLSCCRSCGYGCRGGYTIKAWQYWVKSGIVSGDNYLDNGHCRPYEIQPCSGKNSHKCRGTAGTPRCKQKCVNGADYNEDKTYGASAYELSGEENIKKELVAHGSVEATFKVYDDFPTYKSGVYESTSDNALGLHAVRIIGYGTDNGTPYWLVANSWGTIWGEDGFFRIKRGQNECGIEGSIVAGLPK